MLWDLPAQPSKTTFHKYPVVAFQRRFTLSSQLTSPADDTLGMNRGRNPKAVAHRSDISLPYGALALARGVLFADHASVLLARHARTPGELSADGSNPCCHADRPTFGRSAMRPGPCG